ncbi:MAG: hypothetical protein C0394_05855 [Syntrophus sp. (in: bacteria)]|nr:hypothetical protein [Syntrophus sp. (in: bacteria)]
MNTQSQSGINFSYLASGYDLMESAGKHWMDAVNRMFPDTAKSGGKSNLPAMDAVKAWQQWYEDTFNKKKLYTPDVQALATACIEQQKRCSELGLAWCKCSLQALRAIGGGMRNGDHPAKIMKECMELSEEYVRSCADFLAAQSETLSEGVASATTASEISTEKVKPVKAKAV